MTNKRFDYTGFTLIELLVVIAIIAILAAIIAPHAFRAIEKGKVAKVESDLKAFKTAVMAYYADTGQWPPDGASWATDEEVSFFITGQDNPPSNPTWTRPAGWDGPYLERWPDPPWHCTFNISQGLPQSQGTFHGSYDWDNWGSGATLGVSVSCVPQNAALKVDRDLDDGNLNTGRVTWQPQVGGFMMLRIR